MDDGTTLSKPKQWRGVDQWELFYLHNDPRERRNLYDLPESKTIVAELKAELNRLCNELGDRE